MISPVTGEVVFSDGLQFSPHVPLSEEHLRKAQRHSLLPVPGWSHHWLGIHPSDRGDFEVEAVSDREARIQVVLVAHQHPFYESTTPRDAERRACHEGIIVSDLYGARDFSWGEVFCQYDPQKNRDWLVVAYHTGPQIPLRPPDLVRRLIEREKPQVISET